MMNRFILEVKLLVTTVWCF